MSAEDDKKAAQYRKEAASMRSPIPTPSERAALERTKMEAAERAKAAKAPTTKTEMGEPFKKGGSIRGGGCEQRGKTKGRMV